MVIPAGIISVCSSLPIPIPIYMSTGFTFSLCSGLILCHLGSLPGLALGTLLRCLAGQELCMFTGALLVIDAVQSTLFHVISMLSNDVTDPCDLVTGCVLRARSVPGVIGSAVVGVICDNIGLAYTVTTAGLATASSHELVTTGHILVTCGADVGHLWFCFRL